MDFIVRALPIGREPGDLAIGDVGREPASDEGAYQTSPALGKSPPARLRTDLDLSNRSLERPVVELVVEPGRTLGQIRAHAPSTELVGEPVGTPPAINRTKLDESLREAFIVEEVELIEALESPVDLVVVIPLAAELLIEFGSEVITPGEELQSLVIRGILHSLQFSVISYQLLVQPLAVLAIDIAGLSYPGRLPAGEGAGLPTALCVLYRGCRRRHTNPD
jgi:hypothetical protein